MNAPCPHCGRPSPWKDNPYRPFCSERCKLIDLGKWATEDYRIDSEPDESAGSGGSRGSSDDDSSSQ